METSKIIWLCILLFQLSAASEKIISLDEAQQKYSEHYHIRHLSDKKLLLAQAKELQQRSHQPMLNPITIDFDPDSYQISSNMSMKWQIQSGSELKASMHKALDSSPQYKLKLEHQFLRNTVSEQDTIAAIDLEIQDLSLNEQYEKSLLAFRENYRSLVIAKLQIELQERSLHKLKAFAYAQKSRYEHGEIAHITYQESLANLEKKALDLLKAERNYTLKLTEFKQSIGYGYSDEVTVDTKIQYTRYIPTPAKAIEDAYQYNKPYLIDRLKQERAKHQYIIDQKQQRPSLSFSASIDQDAKTQANIQLSYQLPNIYSAYNEAKSLQQYLHSNDAIAESELALKSKIHQTLINLSHSQSMIDVAQKQLSHQRILNQAQSLKLEHGEISAEAYEDAQLELENAYQNALSAQMLFIKDLEALQQATGHFSTIGKNYATH